MTVQPSGLALLAAMSLLTPAALAQPASPDPEEVPASPDEPDATDADLAVLDLAATDEAHLQIFGFMDASWTGYRLSAGSLWRGYLPTETTFGIGNLNLYLTRSLAERWRSFFEVRFTYAPATATRVDGSANHATAPDPANAQRPLTWGGVSIERAYLEYDATDRLTVQAGAFLTPYGIWNVDHGSPAIVPIAPPWIIGEELFPKQQTGLHLYGKRAVGGYTLAYHATVSNGRGPFQAFRDLDGKPALGARLELTAPWLGLTHLGLSGYRGRFTDRPADSLGADAMGNLIVVERPGVSYDEWSAGADVLIERGPLRLQAELLANQRSYRDGERALQSGLAVPDGRFVGGYLLAGYRFDRFWQVMPFVSSELARLRPGAVSHDVAAYIETAGLNFRPVPNVVLKVQATALTVKNVPLTGVVEQLSLQAAWAF